MNTPEQVIMVMDGTNNAIEGANKFIATDDEHTLQEAEFLLDCLYYWKIKCKEAYLEPKIEEITKAIRNVLHELYMIGEEE